MAQIEYDLQVCMMHMNNDYTSAMKMPYSRRRRIVNLWTEANNKKTPEAKKKKY